MEGCSHGALDAIYQHLRDLETRHNYLVDVLLMCGDFQAIRNHRDMQCMAVPQKYRQLGDFHKYAASTSLHYSSTHPLFLGITQGKARLQSLLS